MRSIVSSSVPLEPMPVGIEQILHRVYFSTELRGYLEEFTGSVTFTGSSYNELRSLFLLGGSPVVSVLLSDFSGATYPSNIVVNDTDWNPIKRTAVCEFVDGGYLSLININAEIKATLNVPKTKSALPMPTYITTGLTYVLPNSAVFASNRVGVSVFDALKTLFSFMTDGQIECVSDYFSGMSNTYPVLISGRELRTGGGDLSPQDGVFFPTISFADLFVDLANQFCLNFSPDGVGRVRIEPKAFFTSQQGGIVIDHLDPELIKQNTIASTFYAKLLFGGDTDEYLYFPQLRFIGFDREEYHVSGQGNDRTALNLQIQTIIVDTNIIQEVINNGFIGNNDTSRDDEVFMVWHHLATGQPVIAPSPVVSGDYYYNEFSTNQFVAQRWFGNVPFSVYSFFGFGNNEANAVQQVQVQPTWLIGDLIGYAILQFANISTTPAYDPNTNLAQIVGGPYNVDFLPALFPTSGAPFYTGPATFYIVPVSGVYTINIDITVRQTGSSAFCQCFAAVYDSADVLVTYFPFPIGVVISFGANNSRIIRNQASITLAALAGHKIGIVMFIPMFLPSEVVMNPLSAYPSSFTIEDSFHTGMTYDETDSQMVTTSIEVDVPDSQWSQFKANPHKKLTIDIPDGRIGGYIRTFDRNPMTGKSTIEIDSTLPDIF